MFQSPKTLGGWYKFKEISSIEVANSNNDTIQKFSLNETNSRRGRDDRKKDRYKIKPIGVKEIIKYS